MTNGETHIATSFAVETSRTRAIEHVFSFIDKIWPTGTTILAGGALAADKFDGTVFASVFRLAGTVIIGSAVRARAMFAGRISLALIDVVLAMITLKTFVAFARVTAYSVDAGTRDARTALALVYVNLTILPRQALHTQAFVSANSRYFNFHHFSFE